MIKNYSCDNCGANMDVNPIMIRIVCPYCGTVYINHRPLTIEEYNNGGVILNNYDVRITKTDSTAIIIDELVISTDLSIQKLENVLEEDALISLLCRTNGKHYCVISKTETYKKEIRHYVSCDKKLWKRQDQGMLNRINTSADGLVVQANLKQGLSEGYIISEATEISRGCIVNTEKPRLFNPGVWERKDEARVFFVFQKQISSTSPIKSEDDVAETQRV